MKANETGTVLGPGDLPSVPTNSGESIKVPPLMSSKGEAAAKKAADYVAWQDTKIAGEPDNPLQKSMDRVFRR